MFGDTFQTMPGKCSFRIKDFLILFLLLNRNVNTDVFLRFYAIHICLYVAVLWAACPCFWSGSVDEKYDENKETKSVFPF